MEKLYTLREVMEYLQVSRQTLYRYNDQGKLEFTKVGKGVRIKESELKKLVNGG